MRTILARAARLLGVACLIVPTLAAASGGSFIGPFTSNTQVASTVPVNGDINPYGVAVVKRTVGALKQGHILVSNFNNSANLQGTGTTIVDVAPNGAVNLFAQIDASKLPGPCPGGVGLTTALVVLRAGWVIVGSLPTTDGTAATAQAGCLIVLNSRGHVVKTLSGDLINGPWDMTAVESDDAAALFVTNVLNGTVAANGKVVRKGTVVRVVLDLEEGAPEERARTVVASGFSERTDPGALVIGPTGVGLDGDGTLYVADTLASRIAAVPNALTRKTASHAGLTVSAGGALNGPLGLAIAPNGHILVTNGSDGNLVETTPGGRQVAVENIDSTGAGGGTLFGLVIAPGGRGVYFVNDGNNTLNLLH
jgi:hypothetical protein